LGAIGISKVPCLARSTARIALVTGESRGTGRAVALGLAGAGAFVIALALDDTPRSGGNEESRWHAASRISMRSTVSAGHGRPHNNLDERPKRRGQSLPLSGTVGSSVHGF